MTDRPIIFSAPMIKALLDGRKSMTRRLLGSDPDVFMIDGKPAPVTLVHVKGDKLPRVAIGRVLTRQEVRYAVGDRLYVREAWAPLDALTHNDPGTQALADRGFYRADESTVDGEISLWRPSIHMPRWASRLTLAVTDVRVQRLQEISEEDAEAEGVTPGFGGGPIIEDFFCLWNSINGAFAADANPWVVAVTFDVVRANIDSLPSPESDAPHPVVEG